MRYVKKREVPVEVMKEKTILALAALSLFALAGCGQRSVDYTPDGETGDLSGNEALTRVDSLGIPDSYQGSVEGIDRQTHLTSVTINAESIGLPASCTMDIVHYKDDSYDSDDKRAVCEKIFDTEKGVYIYDEDPDAVPAADLLDNGGAEGAGDYSAGSYLGYIDDLLYVLTFTDSDGLTGSGIYLYAVDEMSIRPDESADDVVFNTLRYMALPTGAFADENVSGDEASVQCALGFLSDIGISEAVCTDTYSLLWEYYHDDSVDSSYVLSGCDVVCTGGVSGTPAYSANIYQVENIPDVGTTYVSRNPYMDVWMEGDTLVMAETSTMTMGDRESSVELISWDKALSSLPAAINRWYADGSAYSDIEFNDVRLTYYFVKDGDGYKYMPVWVFAQCEAAPEAEAGLDRENPIHLIMLDATSGEFINLTEVLDEM